MTVEPKQRSSVLILLRRRFLAIAITVALGAAAGFAYATVQEDQYEASTAVLIRDPDVDAAVLASQDPAREVGTNLRLLALGDLRERVDSRLNRPFTGQLEVAEAGEGTQLATLTVIDTDPDRAARVANLFGSEYVALRESIALERIKREREAVKDALAALTPAQRNGPTGATLRGRLTSLAIDTTTATGAEQFNRAEPPSSATSPKPLQNTLIGALIGLGLGVALAIFLERRDRRVRDPRYIERVLGRPIIGRIPRSRNLAKSGPGTAALPPPEAEAFRTVRANLRRQLAERDQRSVLITSAIPREGKTTVVWNLARVEAASGAKVLVVEADMRRPVLAQSLGENGAAGLGELLAGEGKLEELIKRVSFEDVDSNGNAEASSVDVLFAGQPSTNPAELLDSERMHGMLAAAPESYDLVVLDTPPTVVSDAMPILGLVGGVVVVGRLGLSTDESLIELREQLDQLDAPTLGVVVNGDDSSADPYHYYRGPSAV